MTDTLRQIASAFSTTPHHRIAAAGDRGDFPLPTNLAELYTAYRTAAEQADSPPLRDTASRLVEELGAVVWQNAETILTRHVQPALAELLDKVRHAAEILGEHTHAQQPPMELLTRGNRVHRAFLALDDHTTAYRNLRGTWRDLRGLTNLQTADPAGLDSPHAVHANLPDCLPHWRDAVLRKVAWPWGTSDRHLLTWSVTHQADLWLPTAAEQTSAWEATITLAPVPKPYRAPRMAR